MSVTLFNTTLTAISSYVPQLAASLISAPLIEKVSEEMERREEIISFPKDNQKTNTDMVV